MSAESILQEVLSLGAGVAVDNGTAVLNDPGFVVGPKLRKQFAKFAGQIAVLTETQEATSPTWRSDDGTLELDYQQMTMLVEAGNKARAAGKELPDGESYADGLQRLGFDEFVRWCVDGI